jgi:hypothetical protein
MVENNIEITQDTIRKKQFVELKHNKEMMQVLKDMLNNDSSNKMLKTRTTLMVQNPSIE